MSNNELLLSFLTLVIINPFFAQCLTTSDAGCIVCITNSLMNEVEVIGDEFIFERYSIDSLQFYESEIYYSKRPRDHYEIYSNVKKRINKVIDTLSIN